MVVKLHFLVEMSIFLLVELGSVSYDNESFQWPSL